jgi:hypothetical protein
MIDWLRQLFHSLRSVSRRAQLELAIEDNIERGMSADEARRQALVRFGGTEQAKLRHREARGLPTLEELMNTLLRNMRMSLRQFRSQPAFTATVVLTLSLGIWRYDCDL